MGGAFALWAFLLFALWYGIVDLPVPRIATLLVLVGIALLAALVAIFHPAPPATLPFAAGCAWATLVALGVGPVLNFFPLLAAAIPAILLAALITHRFPASALGAIFFLVGAYGTVEAFTGVPPGQVVDFLLGGLWVGLVGRLLISRRRVGLRVTPAIVLLTVFIGITLVAALFSQPLGTALKDFRLSMWHMSVALLIACGGFRIRTLSGLTRAMVVVCLFVGAYATLRWAIGPSAKETSLVPKDSAQYNRLAYTNESKVQGSFPDGQELGLWMACALPFLGAMVLAGRGMVRMLALAALPITLVGMFGSGQRTAVASVVAGLLTVLVVHLLSRGFRGPRLGVALAAILALVIAAAVVYPAIVNTPEKRQRYTNLLTPSRDLSFQDRLFKWRQTLADLRGEPFGFGLGTGDTEAFGQRFIRLGASEIDNSYLKIAYEQGIAVMIFFAVALIVLLVELLRFAVWSRAPGPAAIATAAAGVLVSMMVEFMSGIHIDRLAAMAGWMVVGLGMAQYVAQRRAGGEPYTSPYE